MSGLTDYVRGLPAQGSSFLRIVVHGYRSAACLVCLFSSELSNCGQTAFAGTGILTIDQRVEAVSGRGLGFHDQHSSTLDQRASDGIVVLTVGAKTARRTWSKYEKNDTDIANRNRHCRRTPS